MTTQQHGHRTERCSLSNPAAPVPTSSIFNRLTVLAIPLKSLRVPTNIMYAIGRRMDVTSLMSNGASLAERTSGLSRLGRRHMSSPARSRQLPLPRSRQPFRPTVDGLPLPPTNPVKAKCTCYRFLGLGLNARFPAAAVRSQLGHIRVRNFSIVRSGE